MFKDGCALYCSMAKLGLLGILDSFEGKRSAYVILMRDFKDMTMCETGLEMWALYWDIY